MKLRTVPARLGASWVRQGFQVFGKRPLAFALLFTTVLVAIFAVTLAPLLMFLVLPLMPLVSVGFMIATRRVLDGGFPTARVFLEPLRAPRPRVVAMLQLGVLYGVATFLIMWLGDLVDGGGPESLIDVPSGSASSAQAGAEAAAEALAAAPAPLFGLLLRFALAGLLAVPFWHAPALVFWDGHGCAKALFSSTVACWRNRGAFMVYSGVWLGVVSGLSILSGLLFALVSRPELLLSASVPLSLIIATVYYASLYFTFSDCFVPDGAAPLPLLEDPT